MKANRERREGVLRGQLHRVPVNLELRRRRTKVELWDLLVREQLRRELLDCEG